MQKSSFRPRKQRRTIARHERRTTAINRSRRRYFLCTCLNTNLHKKYPNIYHITLIFFLYFTAPLVYIFLFARLFFLLLHVHCTCSIVLFGLDLIKT